ncbi:MAG: thiamine pyrophosphate-dependent dehydrogenase E1 component subunit alpha [Chloroflexi bacterium]|nr:thiamine pyrophosphate-dependent dehydrogenase E1 component subunit alpha [Chloroflexota bacterium]
MQPDLWALYRLMLHSRLFENAVIHLWDEGLISGEMHMGIGEEAIVAGIVSQLIEGDALALDHRGTPPLLMRGVDPVLLLREFLGRPDGLCAGMGGHMHLFSREHLAASSGIVGASGPAAVGFALSGVLQRPGTLAVAFFGEGSMNQGMLLESMNLAVVWNLPVLFVCKDNGWSISTMSPSMTGGNLLDRAHGFGMPGIAVDGNDIESFYAVGEEAVQRARNGEGPTFIRASCSHPEGHMLGLQLQRIARQPLKEMGEIAGPLLRSVTRVKGASLRERVESVKEILSMLGKTIKEEYIPGDDPLKLTRQKLIKDESRLDDLEREVLQEIEIVVEQALEPEELELGRTQ